MGDMPLCRDNSTSREAAIRNARSRLIRLQAASHRVRAELARLEAFRQDSTADDLLQSLPSPPPGADLQPRRERGEEQAIGSRDSNVAADRSDRPTPPSHQVPSDVPQIRRARLTQSPATVARNSWRKRPPGKPRRRPQNVRRPSGKVSGRRVSTAWLLSLGVHAAMILLLGLATFVTLQSKPFPLLARTIDRSEPLAEIEVAIEQSVVDDVELSQVITNALPWDDSPINPNDLPEFHDVHATQSHELSFAASLAGEIGKLMSGTGGVKSASGNSRTSFFGTSATGDRFVFVVDNSGSMQDGRMETTFLELQRSIGGMKPDQLFHVVFYSDRVYPLFYPDSVHTLVPANAANKRKLQHWLSTVELCTGGKLRSAMDWIAELQPQVVYLLTDGEIGSQKTMQFMTEQDWPFLIHTLGMTVRGPLAAAKLSEIAAAHGGTFRMVRPSPAAIRMSLQRPIKYNKTKGAFWGDGVRIPAH